MGEEVASKNLKNKKEKKEKKEKKKEKETEQKQVKEQEKKKENKKRKRTEELPEAKVAEEGGERTRKRRRRRRKGKKSAEGEDESSQAEKPVEEKPAVVKKEKVLKVFRGKVFCITAKGNEDENEPTEPDDELTYSAIKSSITQAGGTVSGILHKRVFALVATEKASLRCTQRVRKALKHDVPIVSVDYLSACIKAKTCVPRESFVLSVEETVNKQGKKSEKKDQKKKSKKGKKKGEEEEAVAEPVVVDLGCCCSCHDSGKASCDWCEAHH